MCNLFNILIGESIYLLFAESKHSYLSSIRLVPLLFYIKVVIGMEENIFQLSQIRLVKNFGIHLFRKISFFKKRANYRPPGRKPSFTAASHIDYVLFTLRHVSSLPRSTPHPNHPTPYPPTLTPISHSICLDYKYLRIIFFAYVSNTRK